MPPRTQPMTPMRSRQQYVARALDQAWTQGGMTLLVHGLPGMGKTFLLREMVRQAQRDARWAVTYVSADEVEHGEPYSFVERLLASGLAPDWDFQPDARTQPIPVAQECVRRLTRQDATAGHVVVIDDAHWIDAESVTVLRYLIPRVARRNVLVAVGARSPHQPGSIDEHLAQSIAGSPLDDVHHVMPLTEEEIRVLAVDRFGVGIAQRTAQLLRNQTGGSFLAVDGVLAQLTPAEVAQLHLTWEIPIRGADPARNPLLSRYRSLSPQGRATTEIVCLAGHEISRADLTTAAATLGEPVHLEESIGVGVLSESGFGATIIPAHALVAHAVRGTVEPGRAERVFRVLAEVTDGYRSVRHALRGARQWDDGLHEQLDRYVRDAVEHGGFGNASEVLRGALTIAPAGDVRQQLLVDLCLVNLRDKSGYLLLDLLPELEQLPPSLLREFLVIMVGAHRVDQPFAHERVAAMLLAPSAGPDDRTIQAFLAFMLVLMTMRSGDPSPAMGLIAQAQALFALAPTHPAELTDPRLGWMVAPREYSLLLASYELVHFQREHDMAQVRRSLTALRGDIDAMPAGPIKVDALVSVYELVHFQREHDMAQVRRSLTALRGDIDAMPAGPIKVDALVSVAGAEAATGDLPAARATAAAAVELLDRVAKPWAAGTARSVLADCLVLLGELGAAADLVAVIEDISYDVLDVESRPMCAALRAYMAAMTGTGDPARHAEQARVLDEIVWEGYAPDMGVMAACEVARAGGDPAAVLAASGSTRAATIVNTRRGFLTYRAHAMITLGDLDGAQALIGDLARWRGTRWHEYWGTLAWLEARLAQARGDHPRAEQRYREALENRTYPLPTALTFLDHGEFLIARGRPREARGALLSACAVLDRIGAAAYLPRARAALELLDDEDHLEHRRLVGELTSREEEISRHLADGWSNRQIADALVVSQATVRFHVSNVLRKLQISSRAEVARVLHGPGRARGSAQLRPAQPGGGDERRTDDGEQQRDPAAGDRGAGSRQLLGAADLVLHRLLVRGRRRRLVTRRLVVRGRRGRLLLVGGVPRGRRRRLLVDDDRLAHLVEVGVRGQQHLTGLDGAGGGPVGALEVEPLEDYEGRAGVAGRHLEVDRHHARGRLRDELGLAGDPGRLTRRVVHHVAAQRVPVADPQAGVGDVVAKRGATGGEDLVEVEQVVRVGLDRGPVDRLSLVVDVGVGRHRAAVGGQVLEHDDDLPVEQAGRDLEGQLDRTRGLGRREPGGRGDTGRPPLAAVAKHQLAVQLVLGAGQQSLVPDGVHHDGRAVLGQEAVAVVPVAGGGGEGGDGGPVDGRRRRDTCLVAAGDHQGLRARVGVGDEHAGALRADDAGGEGGGTGGGTGGHVEEEVGAGGDAVDVDRDAVGVDERVGGAGVHDDGRLGGHEPDRADAGAGDPVVLRGLGRDRRALDLGQADVRGAGEVVHQGADPLRGRGGGVGLPVGDDAAVGVPGRCRCGVGEGPDRGLRPGDRLLRGEARDARPGGELGDGDLRVGLHDDPADVLAHPGVGGEVVRPGEVVPAADRHVDVVPGADGQLDAVGELVRGVTRLGVEREQCGPGRAGRGLQPEAGVRLVGGPHPWVAGRERVGGRGTGGQPEHRGQQGDDGEDDPRAARGTWDGGVQHGCDVTKHRLSRP
ncbi:AAA family ATPase [Georgenia sp. MJ173]